MSRLGLIVLLSAVALGGLSGCGDSGSDKVSPTAQPAGDVTQPGAQSTPKMPAMPTATARGLTADLRNLGKIAYEFNHDIYLVDADGSNERNLTNNGLGDSTPAWSPDGRNIAFSSYRDGNDEIYVMEADGSNPRNLTKNGAMDEHPTWSPDGRFIAFRSLGREDNCDIYVMDADGLNAHCLTNLAGYSTVSGPAWSPDGSSIAFTSNRDCEGIISCIYVAAADGANPRKLTDYENAVINSFVWSPDGRHIAFTLTPDDRASQIHVMEADGSKERNLTNNGLDDSSPAWSPDGRYIAFLSSTSIWVMKADGSNRSELRPEPPGLSGTALAWSPRP